MTQPSDGGIFGPIAIDTDTLLNQQLNGLPLAGSLTETGNGYRFLDVLGGNVRFAHDTSCWYVWDGHRLRPDPGGKTGRVFRDTEKVIMAIRAEADGPLPNGVTPDNIATWANRSSSVRARQAMMTAGAALFPVAITSEQLDADPWLLGVQNGVINLRTGELRNGHVDDLITQQAAVTYDAEATCPQWESHVDYITSGKKHVAEYLQRAAGYTLTGLVGEHAFWFLHGQGGTGKSVFVETLQMLLGDYGLKASQRMLSGSSRAHTTELTDLRRKRLAFIDELEDDASINEARVKMIAGSIEITARGIARDDVTFKNYVKLWICSNAKPKIKDTTDGTWRRMKSLSFMRVIEKMDKDFMTRLRTEWSGILNWCLEGLRRWREDFDAGRSGLPEIAEVVDDVAEYRMEEDPVRAWLDERCELDEEYAEYTSVLWQSYVDWCTATGRSLGGMNDRQLGRALGIRSFESGRRITHSGKKDSTRTGLRVMRNENFTGSRPQLTRKEAEVERTQDG